MYDDGKTTMSVYERKASLREFYGKCFGTSRLHVFTDKCLSCVGEVRLD